jgi:putative redox protein
MANNIKLTYDESPEGVISNGRQEINVSFTGKAFAPYELFLGGYASCLHATFMSIMKKRKLHFDKIEYDVEAEKRDDIPTYISKLTTIVTLYGANEDKRKAIEKSMKQAEHYCSISYTIANLEPELHFTLEFK